MEEHQAGITEYTTATTGFNGILKHRYEDFQVFEVDLAGRTAHLTDLNAPEVGGRRKAHGAAAATAAAAAAR